MSDTNHVENARGMKTTICDLGRKLLELSYQYADGPSVTFDELRAVPQVIVLLDPAGDHAVRMRKVMEAVDAAEAAGMEVSRRWGEGDGGEGDGRLQYDQADDILRAALKVAVEPFVTDVDCPHCGAFERRCAIDDPRRGRFCMHNDKRLP